VADLVLLGLFAGFVRGGWSTGFVRRLFGLLFMAGSFVLGAYFRTPIGAIVGGIFPEMPIQYAEMVGYSVAFTVLVTGFNLFSGPILARLPIKGMSKMTDKVLGAVFGGIEAILIASAAIVILHTYPAAIATLADLAGFGILKDIAAGIDTSTIGTLLSQTTVPFVLAILGPFLPSDITSLVPTTIPGLPGGSLPGLTP
jgi:uncharacterized membrane protein required for colicin V production